MYVCSYGYRDNSHAATKNAGVSGHRPNFPTSCIGVLLPTDRHGVLLLEDFNASPSASDFHFWLTGSESHS